MIRLVDDNGRECWFGRSCANHAGIELTTWSAYTYRGHAPAPIGEYDGRRVWLADEVRAWHASRPGSGNWS